MLEGLNSPDSAVRARAAARLGWRRAPEAVGPLLDALPRAVDDTCAILDALGAIGDPRAIPALRDYATRKLLSRRRSAVEALRNLGDDEGLPRPSNGRGRGSPTRCAPPSTRSPRRTRAPRRSRRWPSPSGVSTRSSRAWPSTRSTRSGPSPRSAPCGPCWWGSHSIGPTSGGTPRASTSVRCSVATTSPSACWATPSRCGRGRPRGRRRSVKSGYDGAQRMTPIFRRKTQDHVRRLGWRYLRNLAAHDPTLYAPAAAEVLVAYTPEDAQEPEGLRGEFARCYLLHRVLWGGSDRFVFDDRRLTFRFRDAASTVPPPEVREEAHPDLWDLRARRLSARPRRRPPARGPRLRREGHLRPASQGPRRRRASTRSCPCCEPRTPRRSSSASTSWGGDSTRATGPGLAGPAALGRAAAGPGAGSTLVTPGITPLDAGPGMGPRLPDVPRRRDRLPGRGAGRVQPRRPSGAEAIPGGPVARPAPRPRAGPRDSRRLCEGRPRGPARRDGGVAERGRNWWR